MVDGGGLCHEASDAHGLEKPLTEFILLPEGRQ